MEEINECNVCTEEDSDEDDGEEEEEENETETKEEELERARESLATFKNKQIMQEKML